MSGLQKEPLETAQGRGVPGRGGNAPPGPAAVWERLTHSTERRLRETIRQER